MWTKRETNVSLTHLSTYINHNIHILDLDLICNLLDFKGAAIAKKKMMKKFGWYKHSEDGGGVSAVFLPSFIMFIFT